MRILLVATKTPWPPIDGGRLVLLNTIDGLRDAGHRVTLIAPVDERFLDTDLVRRNLEGRCEAHLPPASTRGALRSLMQAEMSRTPVTIIRHSLEPVRRTVEQVIADEQFDVAPYSIATAEYLLQDRSSFNLPRKYKIVFSGCSTDCVFASVADLGFFAHIKNGVK
ncbi:MAG: hypothetical protein ABFS37_16375, partial [Acidobacteriota bacterium]